MRILKHPLLYVWITIALGLGVAGALGPAPRSINLDYEKQQRQAKERDTSGPQAGVKDDPPTQAYEPRCPEDDKRHECFMSWRSARAAEAQAKAADAQVWWARAGTWLVLLTLAATVAAAKAAFRAAKAAQQTMEVMQGIARHELRAYLAPEGLRIGKRVDGKFLDFVVAMRNFGQTPARQVTLETRTGLQQAGENQPITWGDVHKRPAVDLPPHQFFRVEVEIAGINGDNIANVFVDVAAKSAKVHAHVVFAYTDMDGVRWRGEFYASTFGATFAHGDIGIDEYKTEQRQSNLAV